MKKKIKAAVACIGLAAFLSISYPVAKHFYFSPDEIQNRIYSQGKYVPKSHCSGLIDFTYKIIENGNAKTVYITGGLEHQKMMNKTYNEKLNDFSRYPDRPTPLVINVATPNENDKQSYDVIQIIDNVEIKTTPFLLLCGYGFYGKLGLNEEKKDRAYYFKDVRNIIDPASESEGRELSVKEVEEMYNKSCQNLESYFENQK